MKRVRKLVDRVSLSIFTLCLPVVLLNIEQLDIHSDMSGDAGVIGLLTRLIFGLGI